MELRAAYKSVSMRYMERLVTNLVKTEDQRANWKAGGWASIGSVLSLILFDWTSAYGLAPQRPLNILLSSILVFALIYWLGMRTGWKDTEICAVWQTKLATSSDKKGIKKGVHGLDGYYKIRLGEKNLRSEVRLLRVALHLSILSAFHIGWKEFDIGMWIKQLQRRNYSLEVSRGWMRTLCGFQSLMSVYLVALWAITQFGRPFE
jgi:hypothetical protein